MNDDDNQGRLTRVGWTENLGAGGRRAAVERVVPPDEFVISTRPSWQVHAAAGTADAQAATRRLVLRVR